MAGAWLRVSCAAGAARELAGPGVNKSCLLAWTVRSSLGVQVPLRALPPLPQGSGQGARLALWASGHRCEQRGEGRGAGLPGGCTPTCGSLGPSPHQCALGTPPEKQSSRKCPMAAQGTHFGLVPEMNSGPLSGKVGGLEGFPEEEVVV